MKLGHKIDNEDNVSIIQGEDRTLIIRLFDDATKIPVNLTGAEIELQFRGKSGSIKRRNFAIDLEANFIDDLDDTISIPGHGLVKNEVVTLATDDTLPAGLAPGNYFVIVVDQDTIKLSATKDGSAVDLTNSSGTGSHTLSQELLTTSGNDAILGTITAPLPDAVTSELRACEKSSPEIEYTIGSTTRIDQLSKAVTVLEQTV